MRLVATPRSFKKAFSSSDIRLCPRSEWTYPGILKNEKSITKHLITVCVVISEQGNANGKRLYSSTTVKKYRFLVLEGSGPLKSILIRSLILIRWLRGLYQSSLRLLILRFQFQTRLARSCELTNVLNGTRDVFGSNKMMKSCNTWMAQ